MATWSDANSHSDLRIAFLLDVDNTLLDNDRLKNDVDAALRRLLGTERADRFWKIYEDVRSERDYVDFPATIERMAREYRDPTLGQELRTLLGSIPFRSYVYPHAIEAIEHFKNFGVAVIVSDGDQAFQAYKIRQSGLEAAVEGNVLIFVHKELELDKVFAHIPASHYVVVDDKPRILAAVEAVCPSEFTTILVRQGKYARDEAHQPAPNWVVDAVGDLRFFSREQFLGQEPRVASYES